MKRSRLCMLLAAVCCFFFAFDIRFSIRLAGSKPPRHYDPEYGYVPFFVVSLVGSDRRVDTSQFMAQSSFSMEFFDAVSGRAVVWNGTMALNETGVHVALLTDSKGEGISVPYDATRCRRDLIYRKNLLTFGEIGCSLSHYMIYRKMVELDLPMLFIIEDDIMFTKSDDEIREILRHLPDPETFDLVYFQLLYKLNYPKVKEWPGTDGYFYKSRASDGTFGYLATNRFARRFIKDYVLWAPADHLLIDWTNDRANQAVVLSTQHRFVALRNVTSEKWKESGKVKNLHDDTPQDR
eukprot:TRINITY_DN6433_c0_g1_i1.p1 TRINITY_DN6433_c0_g1~~TRINITY_DN6433_c0_g1_i1.p1  ORF type:complete len:294 (+),score=123.66 TRINITY_DN6433_c0_g1_i1:197-1078(+)